jgi:hypothetical protein
MATHDEIGVETVADRSDPSGKVRASAASGRVVLNFVIGTAAGLASTFLPRMMLLLSVDAELAPGRFISALNPDFLLLGSIVGLSIGVICAILTDLQANPRDVFMAALGIPALVGGALSTTSATTKLQQAEQQKVAILRTLGDQAGVSSLTQTRTFEALDDSRSSPGPSSSNPELFFSLVSPVFAQGRQAVQIQSNRFDPGIQVQRPLYVLVLKRATSQDEAVRFARELQGQVPTAQAVKTDQGFFVVDTTTGRPEAEALMDAIQLKKRQNPSLHLNPSLLKITR